MKTTETHTITPTELRTAVEEYMSRRIVDTLDIAIARRSGEAKRIATTLQGGDLKVWDSGVGEEVGLPEISITIQRKLPEKVQ